MNYCSIDSCNKTGKIVKNMCLLHYQRQYRGGDLSKGRIYFNENDYIGKKYSNLTAINYVDMVNNKRIFKFLCDCGNTKNISLNNVKNGHTKSCGCIFRDALREKLVTHDSSGKRYQSIYMSMLQRCYNPNARFYHRYGGRGITVCDEWLKSYDDFDSYMGDRPSSKHSIDRIDNDGNYEPGNVRWATQKEQANNTSRSNIYIVNGKRMNIIDAQEATGLKIATIKWRHWNWGEIIRL